MSASALAGVIISVLAYVGLGVALRATGLLQPQDTKPLNTVLIYVALPALVFSTVHSARMDGMDAGLLIVPMVGWCAVVLGTVLALGAVRVLGLEGRTAGALILAAVFGNTGYIGYPIAQAMLGERGLIGAIFYDLFGNTAAVLTLGTLLASRFSERAVSVRPVREIAGFPPFIALALGLALRAVPVPEPVMDWLDALGRLVVPLIMVSVGLSLQPTGVKRHARAVGIIALIKLVALPLAAALLGRALIADVTSLRVAVLETGVPTMMLTVVIGQRFDLDVDLIASAILVTTVGAILTIPLLQLLV